LELIAISDIYGDIDLVKQLAERLPSNVVGQRVIVVAGDIGVSVDLTYSETVTRIFQILKGKAQHVLFVPGETDSNEMSIQLSNVTNLDKQSLVINVDGMRLGFIGLGGAPKHSVREGERFPYLWDENIEIVRQGLATSLKMNLEKAMLEHPDYLILVTHSPPYGVADYWTTITLNEMAVLQEMSEEILEVLPPEESQGKEQQQTRRRGSPKKLGSHMLREFADYYKPDIHIFGHIHKQGGTVNSRNETIFVNVSHLSSIPYKLTGRKFLTVRIGREGVSPIFGSLVRENLKFEDFLETYL